jgi:hypothetical protein
MNANTHDQSKTIVGHPNVLIDSESIHDSYRTKSTETHVMLYDTLSPLLTSRPAWRFVAIDFYFGSSVVITGVEIFEGAEALGKVSIDYNRRGYKVHVLNHRITGKQVRGKGYFTDDTLRATLHIRKNFYVRDQTELLAASSANAAMVINREYHYKSAELNEAKVAVYTKAKAFVRAMEDAYFNMFPELLPARGKRDAAHAMWSVVDSVKTSFADNKTTLVVFNGEQYLTSTGGVVTRYTHDTLPDHMRTKIGLLKLVQDKQMVSSVGCKVDKSTFVLLPQGDE